MSACMCTEHEGPVGGEGWSEAGRCARRVECTSNMGLSGGEVSASASGSGVMSFWLYDVETHDGVVHGSDRR